MTRVFRQQDGFAPEDLFHSGYDHASAAQALLGTSPSHLDSAGYLAHIAVELTLKSWLLQSAGEFKATHSLKHLLRELQEKHGVPPFAEEHQELIEALDSFAELRYPNRSDPTEVGTEEISRVPSLIQVLFDAMPPELRERIHRIDPLDKGGRVLMRKKVE